VLGGSGYYRMSLLVDVTILGECSFELRGT
jgi:hypothetical protein